MNEASSITALPEVCLSEILSLTSPRDVCRAACISKGFNSTADSDAVWERFLPSDYREVIAGAVSPLLFDSKKQLYLYLSDSHILLKRPYDTSFQLDKESGKKCYMLGGDQLDVPLDPRFWECGNVPGSRFSEASILKHDTSLKIRGKIAGVLLSQKTIYVAYLVFRTTRDSMGFDNPAKTRVSFGGIEMETEYVYLQRPGVTSDSVQYLLRHKQYLTFPRKRNDGWMEIKLGEFECNEGDEGDVEMAFEQDNGLILYTGLIVEGIELRPKLNKVFLNEVKQTLLFCVINYFLRQK